MKITVDKLTDSRLLEKAAASTSGKEMEIRGVSHLHQWYKSEHSPIRTQLFWVEMVGIPTFVSVHFVRHDVGIEHFVKSNRPDRGGDGEADRMTPVTHSMLINAQALISMARRRLCGKASKETRQVMEMIRSAAGSVDPALPMLPDCEYRGGCHEFKSCGWYKKETTK